MLPHSKPAAPVEEQRAAHGAIYAIAAAFAFGTVAIWGKLAYRAGAAALPLLALRFVLASAILVAYRRTSGTLADGASTSKRIMLPLLLGGLDYALQAALFFKALETTPAATVSLLFYTYPLWTSGLSFVLGLDRLRPRLLSTLGLGAIGVVVLFLPVSVTQPSFGQVMALAAAVVFAVYLLLVELFLSGQDALSMSMWTTGGASLSFILLSTISPAFVPVQALGPAVALGVTTAFAFGALHNAVSRIGASRFALTQLLEPLTTVALASLVLREPLTPATLVGGALISAALILVLTENEATVRHSARLNLRLARRQSNETAARQRR